MSKFESQINVFRNAQDFIEIEENQYKINPEISQKKQQISSIDLVPGDLIEIPD